MDMCWLTCQSRNCTTELKLKASISLCIARAVVPFGHAVTSFDDASSCHMMLTLSDRLKQMIAAVP